MLVVGVVIAFGIVLALSGGGSTDPNAPEIAGIECEGGERLEYHVHPRVRVFLEGQSIEIPSNLGIVAGECVYWLHTHTPDGIIHVEAPSARDFTLGQFFAIWDEPLSSTQLLDRVTDAEHQIRASVDGAPFEGDPATIPLEDGVLITLEFGPPFPEE
jgi:hypothetical protein